MKKIFKIALVAGAACLAGKLMLSAVAPKIDVTVVADRWDPDPDTGKDEDDAPVDSAEQNAAPEPEAETSVSEEPAPESSEACEADAAEGDVAQPADADVPADAEPAEDAPKAETRAPRRQNKAKSAKENADAE